MAKDKIPAALVDAEVYLNGSNSLAGVAEVELPVVEMVTVNIEQMGMTAELEAPLMGHYKKLDAKIKMDSIDDSMESIDTTKAILVECKGGAQAMDKASQGPKLYGIDATIKGLIKKMEGPKLKPTGKLETTIEMAVSYYKLTIGNKTIIEIDVLNNKSTALGTKNDELRRLMGL
ncbi:hypothetical protein IX317_000642 [Fusobacterium sp. DD29]|uniref:phage major tail tube protein n=1 Tax=unclassified Fusobacterium TaxID=2648384 RepID=UPI001B8D0A83|nr:MULTISPECIES: phage major tail tube protein [unclassified Fusobacterium]MBR8700236.1 hypothetical protein [Fusobacterium sp. DD45]MBR8710509.1 hypothetical protein [Fusobacterium sp. DD28]MBR8748981.1 hypothetical protein [Fusobacterium sp. DD29]MBR8751041.1 hypothetical protein [Fusobacterium sp. DD26]MBR8761287.1 hypothetical protein [Fusobacterium sp. DD25]